MKKEKPNAGQVYYSIIRAIKSCINEEQLNNCAALIESARFYKYCFADFLAGELLIKRCELIAERYPVEE